MEGESGPRTNLPVSINRPCMIPSKAYHRAVALCPIAVPLHVVHLRAADQVFFRSSAVLSLIPANESPSQPYSNLAPGLC